MTFLIQPAAPFHSAATHVSQHAHLHLHTQLKITLLNNVNDSLPPDLFSLGVSKSTLGRGGRQFCVVIALLRHPGRDRTTIADKLDKTQGFFCRAKSFSVKDMA